MKVLVVLCSIFAIGLSQLDGGYTPQDPNGAEMLELLSNFTSMGLLKELHGYSVLSIETQARVRVCNNHTCVAKGFLKI